MNECCNHNRTCRWAVGHNMPGCMPDGDVMHFANWHDARDALIEDVERVLDEIVEVDDAKNIEADDVLNTVIGDLSPNRRVREYEVEIGDYVYWLSRLRS